MQQSLVVELEFQGGSAAGMSTQGVTTPGGEGLLTDAVQKAQYQRR